MSISLIKALGLIKSPIMWLYSIVADQTKIELSGQGLAARQSNTLLIPNNHTGEGSLRWGITTSSRKQVEVLKVFLEYSPPLQLLDPKKMGFFKVAMPIGQEFPFCIYCEEKILLNSELIHAFALTVKFPLGVRELPVLISVFARTINSSVGDFESYGRTQITKKLYRIAVSDKPLRGLEIPPKHFFTSCQPFIIQSALHATSDSEEAISLLVHQQMNDGIASSEIVELPRTKHSPSDNPLYPD